MRIQKPSRLEPLRISIPTVTFFHPMPPIRAGLIGLSGSPPDKYQGLGWAASAHLPYLLDSEAYTFDALCNTSVESARCAVRLHNLPNSTKTYGNVEGAYQRPPKFPLELKLITCLPDDPVLVLIVVSTRTRCRPGYRPRCILRPRRQTLPYHNSCSTQRKVGFRGVAAWGQPPRGGGDGGICKEE